MTISFYTVIVLHPLPGLPGQPRPHSSTSWVSCPPFPPLLNLVPTPPTHRAVATDCAIAVMAAFVGLAAMIILITAFQAL